jgi:hypothetical protein
MPVKRKPVVDQEMIDAVTHYPDIARLDGLLPAIIAHQFAKILRCHSVDLVLSEERVRDTIDYALQDIYKDDNPLSIAFHSQRNC